MRAGSLAGSLLTSDCTSEMQALVSTISFSSSRMRSSSRFMGHLYGLNRHHHQRPPCGGAQKPMSSNFHFLVIAALPSMLFRSPNHPDADIGEKVVVRFPIVADVKNETASAVGQLARKIYGFIAGDIGLLLDDDGEMLHHGAAEADAVLINGARALLATCTLHRRFPSLRLASMCASSASSM